MFSRTANGCGHRQVAMCLRVEEHMVHRNTRRRQVRLEDLIPEEFRNQVQAAESLFNASECWGAVQLMRALSQCVIKWRDNVSKDTSGLIVCLKRPYVVNAFTVKQLTMSLAHVLKEINLVRRA